ncbi:hypothetical protein BV20DRAFT_982452 [Pilatotrama ljubarskyi]|nr:hypothetical protein BV20DRAFT_982452 [Pilatotrama ljubarskyi]
MFPQDLFASEYLRALIDAAEDKAYRAGRDDVADNRTQHSPWWRRDNPASAAASSELPLSTLGNGLPGDQGYPIHSRSSSSLANALVERQPSTNFAAVAGVSASPTRRAPHAPTSSTTLHSNRLVARTAHSRLADPSITDQAVATPLTQPPAYSGMGSASFSPPSISTHYPDTLPGLVSQPWQNDPSVRGDRKRKHEDQENDSSGPSPPRKRGRATLGVAAHPAASQEYLSSAQSPTGRTSDAVRQQPSARSRENKRRNQQPRRKRAPGPSAAPPHTQNHDVAAHGASGSYYEGTGNQNDVERGEASPEENVATLAPAQWTPSAQYESVDHRPHWVNDFAYDPTRHAEGSSTIYYPHTPYPFSPAFAPSVSHLEEDPFLGAVPIIYPADHSYGASFPAAASWASYDYSPSGANTTAASPREVVQYEEPEGLLTAYRSPTSPLFPPASPIVPHDFTSPVAPPHITSPAPPSPPPPQAAPEPPQASPETPWDPASTNEVYPNSEVPRRKQRLQQERASRRARAAPYTRAPRPLRALASDGPSTSSRLTRLNSHGAGPSRAVAARAPRHGRPASPQPSKVTSKRKRKRSSKVEGENTNEGGYNSEEDTYTPKKDSKGKCHCPIADIEGETETCPKTFDRRGDAQRHATYEHLGITLACYSQGHARGPRTFSRPDGAYRHFKAKSCMTEALYQERLAQITTRLRMNGEQVTHREAAQAVARQYIGFRLPCWKEDPRRAILLKRIEKLGDLRNSIEKLERYLSKHGMLIHDCDCCVPQQYDEWQQETARNSVEVGSTRKPRTARKGKGRKHERAIQEADEQSIQPDSDRGAATDPGYESEEDMLTVESVVTNGAWQLAAAGPDTYLASTSKASPQVEQPQADACPSEDEDAGESHYAESSDDYSDGEAWWNAIVATPQADPGPSRQRADTPDSPDVPLSTLPPAQTHATQEPSAASSTRPGLGYDPSEPLEVPEREPLAELDFNVLGDDDWIDYDRDPAAWGRF